MRATCAALAVALSIAACSRTRLPPPLDAAAPPAQPGDGSAIDAAAPAPVFPTQIRIERRNMTCRAATRAARTALKRMSYAIESVATATPDRPGEIRAHRNTGWYTGDAGDSYGVAVRITCDDNGSVFKAATEEPLSQRIAFKRDLPGEIDRAVSRRTTRPRPRTQQPAAELEVEIRPLTGAAARKQIGAAPETVGIMPVHVRVTNRSTLTYRFSGERLRMTTEERVRQQPLAMDEVAAALAPEWADNARRQLMPDGEIPPGATVEGYLFVPNAAYRRAKVVLIETESEEAEGFSVEF